MELSDYILPTYSNKWMECLRLRQNCISISSYNLIDNVKNKCMYKVIVSLFCFHWGNMTDLLNCCGDGLYSNTIRVTILVSILVGICATFYVSNNKKVGHSVEYCTESIYWDWTFSTSKSRLMERSRES